MASRNQLPALSEAQLEIMNYVWDRGQVTVADVWKHISSQRSVARNTIQTMMVRLEEKGWLQHEDNGSGFVFSATEDRSLTLRRMVSRMVETAFQGSAEGLVLALLNGRGVSADEAERIRAAIEATEEYP